MAMGGGGKQGVKADINITPLVDVVLVLLIIFMVITPMLQRGKDVKLPSAAKNKNPEGKSADPIIISVTKDKKMYLEKDEMTDTALTAAVKEKLSASPTNILLKGDVAVTFGDVRKAMDAVQKAGAKGIKLAVEEEK